MQINIAARHGQISEATREKITDKLGKLFRLYDRVTGIDVTVDLEHRERTEIDVRVSAARKQEFHAASAAEELMSGVDDVLHKLEQQLRKHKEKLQNHHRGESHKQQDVSANSMPEG